MVTVMNTKGETLNHIKYHDGFLAQRIGPVSVPHMSYLSHKQEILSTYDAGMQNEIAELSSKVAAQTQKGFVNAPVSPG